MMLKEAWAVRDHPNLHFVFYEDLKEDIDRELRKINDFIGTGLSDQQLKNVSFQDQFISEALNCYKRKNINPAEWRNYSSIYFFLIPKTR